MTNRTKEGGKGEGEGGKGEGRGMEGEGRRGGEKESRGDWRRREREREGGGQNERETEKEKREREREGERETPSTHKCCSSAASTASFAVQFFMFYCTSLSLSLVSLVLKPCTFRFAILLPNGLLCHFWCSF